MSFPRYERYKDSGVEWLGKVPEEWETWKIYHAFGSIGSGTTPPSDEAIWYDEGDIPWVTTGELRESVITRTTKCVTTDALVRFSALRLHPENSLAIAMYGATIGRLGILGVPATTNQACCVLSLPRFLSTGFVFYWLSGFRGILIELFASGGGQPNINQQIIAGLRVPAPTLLEQQTIAAFLDRETAKLDELINEQTNLIGLLKEKRQAVISHAVTKGLDPNAPMKDSGVEWLGEVPEHWEVQATKRLFRLVCEPAPNDNDEELLSIYTDIGVRPRKSLEQKGNKATTTDGYWLVKNGDIIVNKLLAWMGAMGVSAYDGVTSPAYDILRQKVPLVPKFYDYLFRCGLLFTEFRRFSRGIMDMRLRLYFDEFGQVAIPYPDKGEQQAIVNFLDRETAKLDELTSEAQRAIELLKERRSALISAAVTGKIDVRAS